MKVFQIKYENGNHKLVKAQNALELVKKYDLASKENYSTRVIELDGEQLETALDYLGECESFDGVTGWRNEG